MNLLNSRVGGGKVQLEVRIYTPWIRNISLSGSVIGQIQIPTGKFWSKKDQYVLKKCSGLGFRFILSCAKKTKWILSHPGSDQH